MSRSARILVPGEASAVAFARERVVPQLHAWGVQADDSAKDAIRLVVSELLTNAVVHTNSRFVLLGLYYDECEQCLLVVVHDAGREPPQQRHASVEDDHGRGLELVSLLSARHGWEPTSRGKKVWAEFTLPVPVFSRVDDPTPGERSSSPRPARESEQRRDPAQWVASSTPHGRQAHPA